MGRRGGKDVKAAALAVLPRHHRSRDVRLAQEASSAASVALSSSSPLTATRQQLPSGMSPACSEKPMLKKLVRKITGETIELTNGFAGRSHHRRPAPCAWPYCRCRDPGRGSLLARGKQPVRLTWTSTMPSSPRRPPCLVR